MENVVYDLCIVGAGMFGSAAARHASANPALKVCLIGPNEPTNEELKDREIFSSHYDEGRITRIIDDDPACQMLSKHSIKRYRELEKLSGVKFHYPVGCLIISEKNRPYLQHILQASNQNVSVTDLSCEETFQKRYPFICVKKDEVALLDDNGAGHISPRKMVAAQKKVSRLQGCDIYETVVSQIKQLENGNYQIETEKSPTPITAKRLLIATGAFTNTKSFSALKPLNLKKYKRTVTLFKISKEESRRLSSMPSTIYRGLNEDIPPKEISAYILPPIKYPDGNYYIKIGYYGKDLEVEKLEDIKEWFQSKGENHLIDLGSQLLLHLLPGLKYELISSNTCVNCYTPTEVPFIDRITPTITVAVGGSGKGAKLSDEVGRLAAQLSVTGNWDSKLDRTRFNATFQK